MQATFIDVDAVDDIDVIDTAYNSHELRGYIRDRFSRTLDAVKEYGGKAISGFMERTKRVYDKYNGAEALERTRKALRNMKGVKNPNIIKYMDSLDDLRGAGLVMQRYLMADPEIRKSLKLQRCDGYSNTYKDVHNGDTGKSHYDYRRVTDGICIRTKDDEGNDIIELTNYHEILIEGDRELDFEEKAVVLDAWSIQRMFMQAGIDSTDADQ